MNQYTCDNQLRITIPEWLWRCFKHWMKKQAQSKPNDLQFVLFRNIPMKFQCLLELGPTFYKRALNCQLRLKKPRFGWCASYSSS